MDCFEPILKAKKNLPRTDHNIWKRHKKGHQAMYSISSLLNYMKKYNLQMGKCGGPVTENTIFGYCHD